MEEQEQKQEEQEEVKAQFVDPISLSIILWLLQLIIGGIIWNVAGFFAKLGLSKYFEKEKDKE